MVTYRKEPEVAEPREAWVHFLLTFDLDTRPNALLVGARWLGEFAYMNKSALYPRRRWHTRSFVFKSWTTGAASASSTASSSAAGW